MVDIRELAKRAGVSVATVSRALNGHGDVSTATRDRILELADRLGYRPSQAARALVRGYSDVVGLIWNTGYETEGRRSPFLHELLTAVKRALADHGYHLMLLSAESRKGSDVEAYLRVAKEHRLAAVFLMGVDEKLPAVTALIESAVPAIGLDLPVRGPRATYVTSDNRAGAAMAVEHLHSLGHTRIATITGPLELMPAAERLAGYRNELARLGIEDRPEYVAHGDFFLASGMRCAEELLALPEPPTAIFAAADEMAVGVLHVAQSKGVSVPDGLSVVGFDDVEFASLVRPRLTTIAQDREGIAIGAVRALRELPVLVAEQPIRKAAGPDANAAWPAHRIVDTRLVVRESTATRMAR